MAVLAPYPFAPFVRRAFQELAHKQSIFDLPARSFYRGPASLDFGVRFHGRRAATPFGPAAGPQSQLAQNIVLSWLAGGRILELKTVQINDRLQIPRPCIDMETIGFNIEWSQELTLEQSLEEYAKGALLVQMLASSGRLRLGPGDTDTVYDMSVGYDYAGITSPRVQAFLRGMREAGPVLDRLRAQVPSEYRAWAESEAPGALSDTLTLSTFHGCRADEIERIIDHLLRVHRLHCIVKLNPMLLGRDETRWVINEALGYDELRVPDRAFDRELTWDRMVGLVERLGATAASLGLGFGVKFTNTLVVENHRHFFPSSEREMYLSGQPLHVLAMRLVARFRERFGDRYAVSFSGGIDYRNFPDAVRLGLVPVTACTDLLRTGGYARVRRYFLELARRMEEAGARTIDEFTRGAPDAAAYVEQAMADPRYHAARNRKAPPKIGRRLVLFDCLTCDKCVPVCPNDANFALAMPPGEIPVTKLRRQGRAWRAVVEGRVPLVEKHQIGNFADFCNDCGNCDVFCPEDGGPYVLKPRFFGSREAWEGAPVRDGFFIERRGGEDVVLGRFSGAEFRLRLRGGRAAFAGDGFAIEFDPGDPAGSLQGRADTDEIDLTYFEIMNRLRLAVLASSDVNYINCLSS